MVDPATIAARRAHVDDLIGYHAPISRALTDERTSLESRLIPVSAYVITACVETYLRYPEMMAAIDARLPAEEIGRRSRRPGCRVNTVSLWSIANFWLLGRKVMRMVDPSTVDDIDAAHTVLDFWERAARGFRGDGTRQAWDTGAAPVYDDSIVAQLVAGAAPVDGDERAAVKRFNATLIAYLFLLYFDTRVGAGDTGPYPLPDGRVLLVRDYYQLARSDFWWSEVADGRAVLEPHRGAGAGRRHHRPCDRLRHQLHHARGLPRPPRGLRPVHDRRGAGGRAARRSRRTPWTRSSLRCARPSPPSTAL